MTYQKSRLRLAEIKYSDELQEWLTNPKNEDLPNEVIEPKIAAAFNVFLEALLQNEDECAEFISAGNVIDELEFLPLIFEHFKSRKIFEAIKSNCDIAFSNKYRTESEELKLKRKEMLSHMCSCLGL